MKTIFTLMLLLFFWMGTAQDKIYVHTATAANTAGHITLIDHPELNGNPNAAIVYVNNYNPNGGTVGVYNNNVSGLWYDGLQWAIYNEDFSPMIEGASFNIYIAENPDYVITHVATPTNITGQVTAIDHPLLNGMDPGPFVALSHYYNPNGVYNTGNYGQYYFGGFRKLFDEGFTAVPEGAAFKVLVQVGTTGSSQFGHASSASNIVNNWTIIDHPVLNGNPNATFVMSHYWGANGAPSEVYLDAVLGVWYNGSRWAIYTEDNSLAFPENVVFDIIVVPQQVLGVSDNEVASITMHPNPATDIVNFTALENILSIDIYNLLGQEIMNSDFNNNEVEMDISPLSTGTYFAKVKTANGSQTLKLLRE